MVVIVDRAYREIGISWMLVDWAYRETCMSWTLVDMAYKEIGLSCNTILPLSFTTKLTAALYQAPLTLC